MHVEKQHTTLIFRKLKKKNLHKPFFQENVQRNSICKTDNQIDT